MDVAHQATFCTKLFKENSRSSVCDRNVRLLSLLLLLFFVQVSGGVSSQ